MSERTGAVAGCRRSLRPRRADAAAEAAIACRARLLCVRLNSNDTQHAMFAQARAVGDW